MTTADVAVVTDTLKLEDFALIVGAAMGVMSFFWQVFRYLKEGPMLRLMASQRMRLARGGLDFNFNKQLLTSLSVVNVGTQSTTVTHLIVKRYRVSFDRLLRRRSLFTGIVPYMEGPGLPHKIAPGDEWVGFVEQAAVDNHFKQGGALYIGVIHTFGKKPQLIRIRPAKESESEKGEELASGENSTDR